MRLVTFSLVICFAAQICAQTPPLEPMDLFNFEWQSDTENRSGVDDY